MHRGTHLSMPKVVLIHASGLRRIIGDFDPAIHEVPPIVTFNPDAFDVGPVCANAGLVSANPKVIIYKEIV